MKIMVIDGNSILNRAFYGIRQLTNHEGLPTNAVYGFLATLFKLQDEEQPERRRCRRSDRWSDPCGWRLA